MKILVAGVGILTATPDGIEGFVFLTHLTLPEFCLQKNGSKILVAGVEILTATPDGLTGTWLLTHLTYKAKTSNKLENLALVARTGHYLNFKQSDYDNILQQLRACCKHIATA